MEEENTILKILLPILYPGIYFMFQGKSVRSRRNLYFMLAHCLKYEFPKKINYKNVYTINIIIIIMCRIFHQTIIERNENLKPIMKFNT